ncbi:MAG: hypothetical protein IT343_09005 [Candidatus Melainabacteria bacterium]|jgi:hypothetical protein|nr:hypothetical protein [Candidatus Melainabacteria bacterium]
MKRISSLDVLGNPETIAVFNNRNKTISCLQPANEADLNQAIFSTLQKFDSTHLPSGDLEVRSDGTVYANGMYFGPEWHDDGLICLRRKFDVANGISPSDRVLLPGELKRQVLKAGGVIS